MIKIVTADFGIVEIDKPKKVFEHNGIKYAVVLAPYKYMNCETTNYITKVVHYSSGYQIPIFNNRSKTIKGLVEKAREVLDQIFKDLGETEFKKELESKEILNK